MDYDVFMALHEEAHSGWVWFKTPDFPSRTLVRIKHSARSVTCECRILDDRDVAHYNAETHGKRTIDPNAYGDVLIANDWYRTALGIKAAHRMPLTIVSVGDCPWHALRAACHNPNPMVRLAMRLGVLGAWLGIGGVLFALVPIIGGEDHGRLRTLNLWSELFVVVLGVLLGWGCRGIKRS